MTILEDRKNQLSQTLSAWNNLDNDLKAKSINLVMPFIESASLISVITKNVELITELENFKQNYQNIYSCDISQLGSSELSNDSMVLLNRINETVNSNDSDSEKKAKIEKILNNNNPSYNLSSFREKLINELDHKYQNAHAKISYNYGKFITEIVSNNNINAKNSSFKDENSELNNDNVLAEIYQKLNQTNDENEFYSILLQFNKENALSDNFNLLKKIFNLDGIEEHTAINQSTLYRANLDCAELISAIDEFELSSQQIKEDISQKESSNSQIISEENQKKNQQQTLSFEEKAKIFFTEKSQLKSIKVNVDAADFAEFKNVEKWRDKYLENFGSSADITIGYEMEFLVLPFGGPEGEKNREKTDYEKLIKGVADLDARKKMRENYSFPHEKIAASPNVTFLFNDQELSDVKKKNSHISSDKKEQIKNYLLKFNQSENKNFDNKKLSKAIENIDFLLAEEVFFFDLFFLNYQEAKQNKIVLDDVFDWSKSEDENLANIINDIADKGSFYKKTLDMIRASEVSFGPFKLEEAIEAKNTAIAFIRRVVEDNGLRIKDRDVQINMGCATKTHHKNSSELKQKHLSQVENSANAQSILSIQENITSSGDPILIINQSTFDILTAIQTAMVKMIEENPWIARKGQEAVGIKIDRKRGFSEKIKKSNYYQSFDENHNSENDSAFPIHRFNTGKAEMLRFTRLNEILAVVEARLMLNNTHVPDHDEAVKNLFNGIEILPEIFFPYLVEELNKVDLTKKDNQVNYVVNHDGSIGGIEMMKINRGSEDNSAKNNINNPSSVFRLPQKEKSYQKLSPTISQETSNSVG